MAERDQLATCEAVVDEGLRNFIRVGIALTTINNDRLYRETHASFAAYVKDRFGLSVSYAYRQIDAARVVETLSPIGDKITNEAQARELVPLIGNPKRMRAVVDRARGPLTAAELRRARDVGERHHDDPAIEPEPPRNTTAAYRQSVTLSIWAAFTRESREQHHLNRLAHDAQDAKDAGDQEWLTGALATLLAAIDQATELREVLTNHVARQRAQHEKPEHVQPASDDVILSGDDAIEPAEMDAIKDGLEIAAHHLGRAIQLFARCGTPRECAVFDRGVETLQVAVGHLGTVVDDGLTDPEVRRWLFNFARLADPVRGAR